MYSVHLKFERMPVDVNLKLLNLAGCVACDEREVKRQFRAITGRVRANAFTETGADDRIITKR